MRKVLMTALLVAFLVEPIIDPTHNTPAIPPPPAFSVSDAVRFSAGPSAIILPLGASDAAFRLTGPESGVRFDIDGDSVLERVAWPEAGANLAFLAHDTNEDGAITSGAELIGSAHYTDVSIGANALLRMFERSGAGRSGSIHAGHDLYERLLLWADRDHNGRSDRSELTRARERFTAIGLGFQKVHWADAHGNVVRYLGWMQARTGDPEQAQASDPLDERARGRRYFEVVLQTAPAR
jgi:hypothetical protein